MPKEVFCSLGSSYFNILFLSNLQLPLLPGPKGVVSDAGAVGYGHHI